MFFRKLYPEQTADARFPYRGLGTIFAFCNRHGLFACRTPRVQKNPTSRDFGEGIVPSTSTSDRPSNTGGMPCSTVG